MIVKRKRKHRKSDALLLLINTLGKVLTLLHTLLLAPRLVQPHTSSPKVQMLAPKQIFLKKNVERNFLY